MRSHFHGPGRLWCERCSEEIDDFLPEGPLGYGDSFPREDLAEIEAEGYDADVHRDDSNAFNEADPGDDFSQPELRREQRAHL